MQNPKPNTEVRYIGGFPEWKGQTYTIMFVYDNGNDIDVFGKTDGKIYKKSRVDFEEIKKPLIDSDWIQLNVRIRAKVQVADNACETEHETNRDMFIAAIRDGLAKKGYILNLEDGDDISIISDACDPPTRAIAD